MYNGAWDYPAVTRGYTWGRVYELHTRNWSWRYVLGSRAGSIRLLRYFNHTPSGSYADAARRGEQTGRTSHVDAVKHYGGFFGTFDLQRDNNLAFNPDRGPVGIESLRLHTEFGLRPWSAK